MYNNVEMVAGLRSALAYEETSPNLLSTRTPIPPAVKRCPKDLFCGWEWSCMPTSRRDFARTVAQITKTMQHEWDSATPRLAFCPAAYLVASRVAFCTLASSFRLAGGSGHLPASGRERCRPCCLSLRIHDERI